MTRKTTTRIKIQQKPLPASLTASLTAAVTDPHAHDRFHDDGGPVPPEATTGDETISMGEAQEAVDMALRMGQRIGGIEAMIKRAMPTAEQVEQRQKLANILQEVFKEALRAATKHKPMNSAHEGYAVLLEEVDELWDEVKADRGYQQSARTEAVHVAAMAVRYILDLDPGK